MRKPEPGAASARRCRDCSAALGKGKKLCGACRAKRRAESARKKKMRYRIRSGQQVVSWIPAPCLFCGKVFTPSPRAKNEPLYCSKRCCRGAYLKRLGHQKQLVKHWIPSPSCVVAFADCRTCGHFAALRGGWPDCEACRSRYSGEYRGKVARYRNKTCSECGIAFSRLPQAPLKTAYCSDECTESVKARQRRVAKAKRRKRTRGGENIDPLDVFDQFQWRCAHCGCKTPKSRRGTYAGNAPELDHIVPLARGGKHVRKNVQLLCRNCNSQKGDGALNDQTRLCG